MGNIQKFILNLNDIRNDVAHYRNLKQCFINDFKLKTVHTVLEFTQSLWLKLFIDINVKLRTKAKTQF